LAYGPPRLHVGQVAYMTYAIDLVNSHFFMGLRSYVFAVRSCGPKVARSYSHQVSSILHGGVDNTHIFLFFFMWLLCLTFVRNTPGITMMIIHHYWLLDNMTSIYPTGVNVFLIKNINPRENFQSGELITTEGTARSLWWQ
jgi:hypothetical protein